jgi:hypothetical protein
MRQVRIDDAPQLSEWTVPEHEAVEWSVAPPFDAQIVLQIGDQVLDPFLRPGDARWYWRWEPRGRVGRFPLRLTIRCKGIPDRISEFVVRVLPAKLDEQHYHALIDDLQHQARLLVSAFGGGRERADLSSPAVPSVAQLDGLLGVPFERFVAAVERIALRTPDRLHMGVRAVDPGRARRFTRLDRPDSVAAGAGTRRRRVRTVAEAYAEPTVDTYEHRVLLRVLLVLQQRLDPTIRLPPDVADRFAAAREHLRRLRRLPLLQQLTPVSGAIRLTPRMRRDRDYRAVYRMWQALRRQAQIVWADGVLDVPIAELHRLYEIWCVTQVLIELTHMPGWQVVAQQIVTEQTPDHWVHLPGGRPLLTLVDEYGTRVELIYHPRIRPSATSEPDPPFRSLDRHTRIPDIAVMISRPAVVRRLLLLDAKYRLAPAGGVPPAALADAYSYLAGIGDAAAQPAVQAVALLYPGAEAAEEFASGVALVPCLPGQTAALGQWLHRQVAGVVGS